MTRGNSTLFIIREIINSQRCLCPVHCIPFEVLWFFSTHFFCSIGLLLLMEIKFWCGWSEVAITSIENASSYNSSHFSFDFIKKHTRKFREYYCHPLLSANSHWIINNSCGLWRDDFISNSPSTYLQTNEQTSSVLLKWLSFMDWCQRYFNSRICECNFGQI